MDVRPAVRAAPLAILASLMVVALASRARRHDRPHAESRAVAAVASSQTEAPIAESGHAGAATKPPIRMEHGDRRRCAREDVRGPSALHVKWKTSGLGAIEAQPIPSPDESTIYVSSLGGDLVALAREDGKERFRVPLGGRSYASPCVDARGYVYSASDAKKVFAIDPKGVVAWTLEVDGEADTACALRDDGDIVLAAGRTLYAITPNGNVAWRFSARGKIFTAPAIDDQGRVYFGSQDDHVYGVEHGNQVFAVDLGGDVDGSPAIDDEGNVVVGTDYDEVVKLDRKGGVLWATKVGGYVRGPISIARGGDVLTGVYGPWSRVVRLDGKTGKTKATLDVPGTGALEFGVHGGPLEDAAGQLFFGAQDDRLYAIDPHGKTSFTLQTGGDVDAPPTLLSNGALVVASDDGAVYYLDP
ncbi:MAG TPA: PQQ-binding-like beta-propeller repeat protein [Polyangiaceae bacterium]